MSLSWKFVPIEERILCDWCGEFGHTEENCPMRLALRRQVKDQKFWGAVIWLAIFCWLALIGYWTVSGIWGWFR